MDAAELRTSLTRTRDNLAPEDAMIVSVCHAFVGVGDADTAALHYIALEFGFTAPRRDVRSVLCDDSMVERLVG
jgi:hypothetical protein